ncbi:MAG TPA: hypothetical protein VE198_14470 [Actinoallomurus sp.]|nr:hypothetical protein [Actinoallomurus sp.]
MSEQPASVLFEAVRLAEVLRKRMSGGAGSGDVWSEATSDAWGERIATGAPECRYCPVCRAIAASRTSGPDVVGHVVSAGESLFAAVREAVAGFERTRPPRQEPDGTPADGGDRPHSD